MKKNAVIALAGNPNVGKSTVFNNLTGLKQHTGNWAGKTVTNAKGTYCHRDIENILVDLPGTYSLHPSSLEEKVARDFICSGRANAVVVVIDATCLERNLNLALQIIHTAKNVVICVNLMDEAKRKGIYLNLNLLSLILDVPVVGTYAINGKGMNELKEVIYETVNKNQPHKSKITFDFGGVVNTVLNLREEGNDEQSEKILRASGVDEHRLDEIVSTAFVNKACEIAEKVVCFKNENYTCLDRRIDGVLTSKKFGIPIMVLLLCIIFWITMTGANIPSEALSSMFFFFEGYFVNWLSSFPDWVTGFFIFGIYRTLGWVISVMLPPMAIFFPLFTLLEDLGYLPRIAFNLDNFFQKACACGKQSLTMCMGFGCNAVGVTGTRIIDSPRERLIAIITNNFVPCNGRFPTLIAIITMFFVGGSGSLKGAVILTGVIILGVMVTLMVSKLLSKTLLKGLPTAFTLELPPYRKPQIGRVLVRSFLDRTLMVLSRAVVVAVPAGAIIWLCANISIQDISLLRYCADFLDPFAKLIGLDGIILFSFILGFPANEIVIPIAVMGYMSAGYMSEIPNITSLHTLLVANGWTWVTAVCTILFSLMHFPCATTCMTIYKETKSVKWTIVSFFTPTVIGVIACFAVNILFSPFIN